MEESRENERILEEGDFVLLRDRRGRRYLVTLKAGGQFDSHLGAAKHDDVIGQPEGVWLTTASAHTLLVMRPTLADYILEMPRIATVSYPKDIGVVLVQGDIFPGAKVLEAGTGSGGMTMALLRAVGSEGHVTSYDAREDMTKRATQNIESWMPEVQNLTLKKGDVYEGFSETGLDRIILDLAEPWHVVPHAADALVNGGTLLCFVPTVLQIHQLVMALTDHGSFDFIETTETLNRSWHVGARSIRPEHRMVGHTGFIVSACLSMPRPVPPAEVEPEAEPESKTEAVEEVSE